MPHSKEKLLSNVSRETIDTFNQLLLELAVWNKSINLVAASTIKDAWQRHIIDSLQLIPHLSKHKNIIDLGSGAGFPALVIAISRPDLTIVAVESDRRKCEFMRHIVRLEKVTNLEIKNSRIEQLPSSSFDYVTSRACAPLSTLFAYSSKFIDLNSKLLFLKGSQYKKEICVAHDWRFTYTTHQSVTQDDAVLLEFANLEKKTS